MKQGKRRLDVLLVERGLFPSREAARRAIMAGLVSSHGEVMDKPGHQVTESIDVSVQRPEHQFVSRGGLKLERAIQSFNLDFAGRVVIDVGASTGGFTDCSLQHGAAKVYAVDVGYGQLAWKLRTDPRVVVMERTNFRHMDALVFDPKPDAAVMDVSFISTRLLLPKLVEVVTQDGFIMSLIKPQFEAGRDNVGKGGIVRDPNVHLQVLSTQLTFIHQELGLSCGGLDYSPVMGGDGNIEYLALWKRKDDNAPGLQHWLNDARVLVQEAWRTLKTEHVTLDSLQ